MLFAIYTRANKKDIASISQFVELLSEQEDQFIYHQVKKTEFLGNYSNCIGHFQNANELAAHAPDFVISFGGDGTVLDTMLYVLDSNIPIIGCNTGRLGFLATLNTNQFRELLTALRSKNFSLGKRSVLKIDASFGELKKPEYALNDISIHKRDTSAMITIDTYLNGDFFNTYWADGLLISTPTGSTAYSLSCGGPLMFPDSAGFILNPVAPHNLNVRPVVLSNDTEIKLKIKGRGTKFLMSLDARYRVMSYGHEVSITKAPFELNFVELEQHDFISTLREKLNWGKDNRNN